MQKPGQISELKDSIFKLKKYFLIVGFFSFFINLLMLVPPLYMLQLYDRVVTSKSVDTLILLTMIVVILFITMSLLEITRSKIIVRLSNKIDDILTVRVFDSIFYQANKDPARATSSPISDVTQMRQFMTGNGLFAFFDAPWFPIYLGILFIFHPYYGYFAIFAATVLVIVTYINEKHTKEPLGRANAANRGTSIFVESNIRNSEVIHAMGMLPSIKKTWKEKHDDFLTQQTIASENASIWTNSTKTLRMMFQSLMLGLGGYLAITNEVTPGMMIAGSIVLGRALAPLDLIVNTWKQFSSARTSYKRIDELLENSPADIEYMQLPDPVGEISVENIVLVPPKATKPSLFGVNLQIDKGEIVGIIGPSAAGKSSLARAILGIWPLNNGNVRLDKADIKQYDRGFLGKFIGYLPQDIELFEGTVAQNIARFTEVDSTKVVKAAQMAGVHEMILQLSDGYDTVINSSSLSGGQKQRIALARALYDDPILVVLDEPNSNLDDVGELALVEALKALKERGTTVILITHKRNVLMATTKLAYMKDGKVELYGPTQEVLQKLGMSQPAVKGLENKVKPKIQLSKPGAN
ncbi:type I secretion system permease/ATPase [Poseidonibacter antarcticus]|uniref:type I secretion system permease/ATPase n=1 Tax=Poseidonibacter antarcticus TaxID=2478538 RepID=UPI000EF47C9B|nr:type I secretion system permease/ATPase [Poseidonibacter antarcticus]